MTTINDLCYDARNLGITIPEYLTKYFDIMDTILPNYAKEDYMIAEDHARRRTNNYFKAYKKREDVYGESYKIKRQTE